MKLAIFLATLAVVCTMAAARFDGHIYWDPMQGRFVQDQAPTFTPTQDYIINWVHPSHGYQRFQPQMWYGYQQYQHQMPLMMMPYHQAYRQAAYQQYQPMLQVPRLN